LRAARTLLFPTGDWVNQTYVELLYGRIQRALARRDDQKKLMEAVAILQKPYKIFDPASHDGRGAGHLPHRCRAAYELALAYLYAGKLEQADTYRQEVWRIAVDTADARWQSHALIVRIMAKNGDCAAALSAAQAAKRHAIDAAQLLCQGEALIAEGEAHAALGETDDALTRFREALDLAHSNLQTKIVCHLQIAKLCLSGGDLRTAQEHFGAWRKVQDRIQNEIVRGLAAEVSKSIEKHEEGFTIPWSVQDLNFDDHVQRLREFLIRRASVDHKTNQAIADALGISRQTLYKKTREKE
jgi:tetratricopeptide (TPR) repeat protein